MRILISQVDESIFSASEIKAALKMRLLLTSLGPCLAAFLSCHSMMGSKKIISSKFFLVVLTMINDQSSWAAADMEIVLGSASILHN
jgi:hypothetical protein